MNEITVSSVTKFNAAELKLSSIKVEYPKMEKKRENNRKNDNTPLSKENLKCIIKEIMN